MWLFIRWIKSDSNPLFKKIGRRGLILTLTGLIWVLYGIEYLQFFVRRFSPNQSGGFAFFAIIDSPYLGWVWIICGAVAMVIGVARNRIQRIPHDSVGFNAILLPAVCWAIFYFWSWVIWIFTGGDFGIANSSVGFLVWSLVTIFILIIAGWPDPSDPQRLIPERQELSG